MRLSAALKASLPACVTVATGLWPLLGIVLCGWGAVSRWGAAGLLVPGALIYLDNFASGLMERRG